MIPGVDLVTLINVIGILGVAFIVFAESGLLIGFFLPGDSLLFTTGFLITAGVLDVNIHVAVLIIFAAAVIGDNVGYTIGHRAGPLLFKKPDARLFKQEYITRAKEFYDKHGGKTIILARFVPIVRTFVPFVAGASNMDRRKFFGYNIIGGLLWAAGITYTGYFLGHWFESMGIEIDQVLLPIIILGIIFISILPAIFHILANKKSRDAIIASLQKRFSKKR